MLVFRVEKRWFDKIIAGEKTHEYRKATPYWQKRYHLFSIGNIVEITCGYPKNGKVHDDGKPRSVLAIIMGVTIKNGMKTDLQVNEVVFDIEFSTIKGSEK